MTQAVRAMSLSRRRRGFRQVPADDVVEATCGQRPVRCSHRQEDDAARSLGASMAQVVCDRVPDTWLERQRFLARRLRSHDPDPVPLPVEILEP